MPTAAVVLLSERHKRIAERYFRERAPVASPGTPRTTGGYSSADDSNSSFSDVTFNFTTPKRSRDTQISPEVLSYQRKTVVRGATIPVSPRNAWECPSCTNKNPDNVNVCDLCLDPRPK